MLGWILGHVPFFSCSVVSVRSSPPALLQPTSRALQGGSLFVYWLANPLKIMNFRRSLAPFVNFCIIIYFSFEPFTVSVLHRYVLLFP